jgi:hypothetical protein
VLKINLNSDFKIIVTQCALYTTLSLIFRWGNWPLESSELQLCV